MLYIKGGVINSQKNAGKNEGYKLLSDDFLRIGKEKDIRENQEYNEFDIIDDIDISDVL
jgi:hypothetical protein